MELYNVLQAFEEVTVRHANSLCNYLSKDAEAHVLLKEAELLIAQYCNETKTTIISRFDSSIPCFTILPLVWHKGISRRVTDSKNKKIIRFIADYNSTAADKIVNRGPTWLVVSVKNVPAGLYLVQLTVNNRDRASEEPFFIHPWVLGRHMPPGGRAYFVYPHTRCYDLDIALPVVLMYLANDKNSVNLFMDMSSHIEVSAVGLVSLSKSLRATCY